MDSRHKCGVLIGLVLLCLAPARAAGPFEWGINGHPVFQVGYLDVPIAAQLDLVSELGVRWLRWDISARGFETRRDQCDELVAEAARRKIKLLPVLFSSPGPHSKTATPEQIRAGAVEFARAIVSRYKDRITHWELSNELDGFAMLKKGETDRKGQLWKWGGDPDGNKPEQYEETRYQKSLAEIAGLAEGVRLADPAAIRIVDTAGWLHDGFVERLIKEDKVPFEILAWHWYSEMGDMTSVRGKINMVERLRQYGKPIWVNEINRRAGSMDGKELEQARYIAQIARQLRGLQGIEAFFIYELFDEPYFGPKNPESHYGLVELTKSPKGKWQAGPKKQAFEAFKGVVREFEGK